MKRIIVTVRDERYRFSRDMEIPADLEAEKLVDDIVETIKVVEPGVFIQAASIELFCERTGRTMENKETAETAGIWNGDYITLRSSSVNR